MVRRKRTKGEEDLSVDPTSRSFFYDEVDDFNAIDQDDPEDNDYGNGAKVFTNNKRKEQVLGLDLSSSDESEADEDDDNDFKNDIQSSEGDDDEPEEDFRTMGKRKRDYFGTDITDTRLHNVGKVSKKKTKQNDEEALQVELDMANQIQKSLLKHNEAFQFSSDDEDEPPQKQKKEDKVTDPSKNLKSKKTKIQDADFIKEVQEKCHEVQSLFAPLIEDGLKKKLLPDCYATEYLRIRYYLTLNYFNNAMAKRLLQHEGEDVSKHPVEARLTQFRVLFKELDRCKPKLEPELCKMLEDLRSGKLKKQSKKLLGIIKAKTKGKTTSVEEQERPKGEMETDDDDDDGEVDEDAEDNEEAEVDADGRRLISYQIAKNKGLMPARKKEQRNPRVKYKKKYQNKLKRRKGQVREVRKEMHRYTGESSGIKSNVIKSIKFK